VNLTVEPLRRRDAGRGLAAVDDRSAVEAGLQPGDFVRIDGPGGTAVARVWPGYPADEGRGVVRIGRSLREQVGAEPAGEVRVEPADVSPAEHVTIAFAQRLWLHGDPAGFVRKKLAGLPVTAGQVVDTTIRVEGLLRRKQRLPVEIVDTVPAGRVLVTADTTVRMGGATPLAIRETLVPDETVELVGATADVDVDERVATVTGEVSNTSGEPLDEVAAEAVFYRDAEATYHIESLSDRTSGLRPGKVWPFEIRYEYGRLDRRPRSCELAVTVG